MAADAAPAPARTDASAVRLWLWCGLVLVVALVVAWQFVGAPPPSRIVVATGGVGGGYERGGQRLATELAEAGIEVELRPSAGSEQNLAWLRGGQVDLAFVQGGVADAQGQDRELQAVASLYYEPLWVFVAAGIDGTELGVLSNRRIEIGAQGSGSRPVALDLLGSAGVDQATATLLDAPADAAAEHLLAGRCDAVMLVAAPTADVVRRLCAAPGVRLMSLQRAWAISRHFPFLDTVELTPGLIDLQRGLPAEPVRMVAPVATWVARSGLHPAVVPLVIEAAERIYGGRGLLEDAGEFPHPRGLQLELAPAADNYFRRGPSFLYRVLPFQVAATLDRLKIMLLPLLTLLIPLLKLAPPLYRWRTRSRITRWYRSLLDAEVQARADSSPANLHRVCEGLDALDRELAEVEVPLSYAEELYNVRMHLRLVRRTVKGATQNAV